MKRGLLCAIAGALMLGVLSRGSSSVSAHSPSSGPLSFFKNFFITGDYVVGGVGMRGTGVNDMATGTLQISGVPAGADIHAAYLYWQIAIDPGFPDEVGNHFAAFNGHTLYTSQGPFAKTVSNLGSASCSGPGTGVPNNGLQYRTFTYRADVLRFLPTDADGKLVANGPHTVRLPDRTGTDHWALALGASLVIVYQDSTKPLNAVVIYDGSHTVNATNPTFTQDMAGFYQPAATPDAKITYIAGSASPDKHEKLSFNNGLLAMNPFASTSGAAWDNLTYSVNPGTASHISTQVDTTNLYGPDCITFGATIFKTAVKDTDGDGLLDVWETATSASPVLDPNGQPLPALGDMFANPNVPDVFLELGYMHTAVPLTYGGVGAPAHSHQPTHEAIKLVGDTFARRGVRLHVDAGEAYPFGDLLDPSRNADEYLIRGVGLARGGEAIDESVAALCVSGGAPWDCQFSDFPGTVGWKTGFRYLRDEVLSGPPPPPPGSPDPCDEPGSTCERRFDRNRKDIFHYALFAHALGLPRSESPCLDGTGQPTGANSSDRCDIAVNPEFRRPLTTTGVADFPGGDVLVTLGAFADASNLPIGTPFMQASTLTHELGHNFGRRHSGEASTAAVPNPNCKPTYLSVMNYLYQLRGLVDDAGKAHLDFSGQVGPTLKERELGDGSDLGSWQATGPYRIGWYAPLAGSYLAGRTDPVARHCDGSGLLPTDVPMVRLDAPTALGPIDWNGNGVLEPGELTLDVNFNGRTSAIEGGPATEELRGSDDWSQLRFNQVGGRRSSGGLYLDSLGNIRLGPLSLDAGRGDYGRGDYGRGDYGRGDYGRGDYGRGDLGRGDYGRGDYGRGDYGRGDYGRGDYGRGDYGGGDLFQGDPNNLGGELDFETAGALAKTPPNEFTACVVGVGNCQAPAGSGAQPNDVVTTLKHPNIGGVAAFRVFRVAGPALVPGQTWVLVQQVPTVPGQIQYVVVDGSTLTSGAPYTYFAVALYGDNVTSDPSNPFTITGVDHPPTISAIGDQTIKVNSTTGPIAFTISDANLSGVTLSAASSNTTLVPAANIVFGGSGASRTVKVTPAPHKTGTATITVTVTDAGGQAASETFLLTVTQPAYAFIGFFYPLDRAGTEASPSNSGTFKRGDKITIRWQLWTGWFHFTRDLDSLSGLKALPGQWTGKTCALSGGTPLYLLDPVTGQPTSGNSFEFDDLHFQFDWKTNAAQAGLCYNLTMTLNDGSAAKVTTIRFK